MSKATLAEQHTLLVNTNTSCVQQDLMNESKGLLVQNENLQVQNETLQVQISSQVFRSPSFTDVLKMKRMPACHAVCM